eukprot:2219007-Pyramimonas_sp.AAC.2
MCTALAYGVHIALIPSAIGPPLCSYYRRPHPVSEGDLCRNFGGWVAYGEPNVNVRGSGAWGCLWGKYRSSVDAREPQNPTKSEEYQCLLGA